MKTGQLTLIFSTILSTIIFAYNYKDVLFYSPNLAFLRHFFFYLKYYNYSKSNKILEDIIEIEDEILSNDEDGEVIETTTKFEFNLGFAKVSRSIKKIKK